MTAPWDETGPGAPAAGPPPIPTYVPPTDPYGYGVLDDRRAAPTPPPAPTGLRYADWGERVGATLVDWTLIWVPSIVLAELVPSQSVLPGLLWLALAGYVAWRNGSRGQSPGKALMGIKLLRETDGSTLGGPVGLGRSVVLVLMGVLTGGLLWLLSVLWPLWNRRHRALHDMIFSATVVAGLPRATFGRAIFRP